MTQKEFITQLKQSLEKLHINHIGDIVSDYEEHFSHALKQGKSEDQICQKLGQPDVIAKAYETESMILKVKNSDEPFAFKSALSILGRLIVIMPFNFLVLCIPGSILFALLMAGWSIAIAAGAMVIAIIVVGVQTSLLALSTWLTISFFSSSLFALSLTVVLVVTMFLLTKQLLLFAINYLRWNLKYILQK